MPVESVVTGIADLNPAWPLGSDQKQYGDDHIRNIKLAVKTLLTEGQQLGFTTIEHTLTVPTTNITFTGVVQRGSQVVAILQQDATGGRQVTWDAVFDVTPAPGEINLAPNGLTLVAYVGRSNGKLTCYSVRTGATIFPALGTFGRFLMDTTGYGSTPNPNWQSIPIQTSTKMNTGDGGRLFFSLVGDWDLKLLKIGACTDYGGAPFSVRVRRDTVGSGSDYLGDVYVMQPSAITGAITVSAAFQNFSSLHTLRVEYPFTPPANVPYIMYVSYEPFPNLSV